MLRGRGTVWCSDCGSWHTLPDTRSDFGEVESFLEALEFYRPIWSRDEEILRGVNPEDGGIFF